MIRLFTVGRDYRQEDIVRIGPSLEVFVTGFPGLAPLGLNFVAASS
jgi:hypothetical protein